MAANRVKFGLKNVHYAICTETVGVSGTTTTYGTMKAWPGAVNLSLDPAGSDDTNFDADDGVYYVIQGSNSGYTGTFESALIPEDVETEVLGRTTDTNGVIIENQNDVRKYVALAFEVDGDQKATRHLLYRCMIARPSTTAATKTSDGGNTPQTESVNFTATARPDDGKIKAKTSATVSTSTYEGWFSAVYNP